MAAPSVQSVSGPTRYTSGWTHAHTCGGSNNLLLVAITHNDDGVVSGVTYNGDAMDWVGDAVNADWVFGTRLYKRVAPDSGSSYNVVVSWTTPPTSQAFITAVCVQDVNQSTPLGTPATATSTGTTHIQASVSSATGDLVVAFGGAGAAIGTSDNTFLSGSPNNNGNSNWHDNAQASQASGAASVTVGHTIGATDGGSILGVSVKPLAGGASIQEGFRFRNDDGDEAGATWAADQDANLTAVAGDKRIRLVVDTTGDLDAAQFQLEWSKDGEDVWRKVEN